MAGNQRQVALRPASLGWQVVIKPTGDEMFSERNGFTPTWRFAGWSFVWRRYWRNDT